MTFDNSSNNSLLMNVFEVYYLQRRWEKHVILKCLQMASIKLRHNQFKN